MTMIFTMSRYGNGSPTLTLNNKCASVQYDVHNLETGAVMGKNEYPVIDKS